MAEKFSLTAQINLQAPTSAETKKAFSKIKKDLKTVSTALNLTVTKKTATEALKNINKHLKNVTVGVKLKAPTSSSIKKIIGEINSKLKGKKVEIAIKVNAGTSTREVNKLADATKRLATNTKAATQVKKLATETKGLGKEAKSASLSAAHMGDVFGSALKVVLKYDIARRVFSGFTNVIEQGIGDAIKFERELVRIAQVSGQTTTQLKGLEKTVFNLAKTLGVSSSGLIKTGLILKQTGLSVKDTEIALKALAKTELAPTFDNIADTAETAVAAMRQFGIEASGLEVLLSRINTVSANFAIEASDIGVAIKRAGGSFKAAGGNIEELIALMTSVRSTTRETAETIATGFRTIFTRLQRPTTIKFLRQFGIELTDLNGKFVGPFEAVKRLSNALQNLESTDLRFSAIVEQLGGFRQVSKVIPLIQQFGTAQEALNAQLKGSDSLAKDAAIAQQSLAVQMAKVTAEVKELFQEMSQTAAFKGLATIALGLARAITAMGKAIAPVIPLLTALFAIRVGGFIGGKLKGGGIKGLLGVGSAKGGIPETFAKGGWVPGSGSGDTVPAMLTPGEFVVRKSSAQAMGSRMEGINKYAKGGAVNLGNTKKSIANRLVGKKEEPFSRGLAINDTDDFEVNIKKEQYTSKRLAALIKKQYKGQKKQRGFVGSLFSTKPVEKGRAFEKLIKKQNRFQSMKSKISPIDFKEGSRFHEARFTQSKTSDNEYLAKVLLQRIGEGSYSGLKNKAPTSNTENINLGKLTAHERASGVTRNSVETALGFNKKSALARKTRKAKGGGISGPDTVPAMLTPGEFVVNKKSAQAFGHGNLSKINKFNKGGPVGKAASGVLGGAQGSLVNVAIFSGLTAGIQSLLEQFGLMNDGIKAFTSGIGSIITTFVALKFAASAFADTFPKLSAGLGGSANKQAFGAFGGGGIKVGGERLSSKDVQERNNAVGAFKLIESQKAKKVELAKVELLKAEAVRKNVGTGRNERGQFTKKFNQDVKPAQEKLQIAKDTLAENEKGLEASKADTEAKTKSADAANKAAGRMKALGVAAQVGALALAKLGDIINTAALESIKSGNFEGRSTQAAAGGALSGGGLAGAGALALGLNPVVGGLLVLGASIFGAATAFKEAEKLIAKVKLDNSLEETAKSLEKFKSGQTSAIQSFAILDRQAADRRSIKTGSFGLDSEQIASERISTNANAELFAKGLAKSAVSSQAFEKSLQKNASRLIEHGNVSGILIETLKKEIDSRLISEEKLREFSKAQQEATEQLIKLKGISSIIGELKSNVEGFNNTISGISSIGSGIGPIGSLKGILESKPRSKEGVDRLNKAINKVAELGRGQIGLQDSKENVKSGAAVTRNLEAVLTSLANIDPTKDDATGAIIEQLKSELKSENSKLTPEIEDRINKALRTLEITSIGADKQKITDKIESVLSETIEPYKELGDLISQRNNFLKNAFAELSRLEGAFIQSSRQARDARIKAELDFNKSINTKSTGPETDASVQARFFSRIDKILSPTGVTNLQDLSGEVGGGRSIDAIGKKLEAVTKELTKNAKLLADPTQSGIGTAELIESQDKLNSEFTALRSALGEYANTQARLTVINEELVQSQNKTKSLRDLAIKMSFGTSQQKNEAQRLVNAIVVAKSQGIQNVAPELQLQVIPLLEELLGQEGRDIVDSELGGIFKDLGLSADGIINASKNTIELAGKAFDIQKQGAAALAKLAENDKQRLDSLSTTIEKQNAKFLEDMRTLFKEEQIRQVETNFNLKDKEVQRKESIGKLFGGDQQLFNLLKGEGGLQEAADFKELNKLVNNFNTGGFGLVRDALRPRERGNLGQLGTRSTTILLTKTLTRLLPVLKGQNLSSLAASSNTNLKGQKTRIPETKLRASSDKARVVRVAITNLERRAAQMFTAEGAANFSQFRDKLISTDPGALEALTKAIAKFQEIGQQMEIQLTQTGGNNPALVRTLGISDEDIKRMADAASRFTDLNSFMASIVTAKDALERFREVLEGLTGSTNTNQEKQPIDFEQAMERNKKRSAQLQVAIEKDRTKAGTSAPIAASVPAPAPVKLNAIESELTGGTGLGRSQPSMENQRNLQRISDELIEKRRLEAAPAGKVGTIGDIGGGPKQEAEIDASVKDFKDKAISLREQAKSFGMSPQAAAMSNPTQLNAYIKFQKKRRGVEGATGATGSAGSMGGFQSVEDRISLSDKRRPQVLRPTEGRTGEIGREGSLDASVPLLSEILMVLKGQGGEASSGSVGGGSPFSIDTTGLNSSVEKFSKSIGDLEKVMGSPLSIQVGGEINLNVNLNGAEFLRDAKDSFAQLAGQKITQGINNFIRDGLKNSGIGISSNWVGDESTNQRMARNSSSGSTA